jgi:hypothetical protein
MYISKNTINYITIGTNDKVTGILQSLGLRKSPLPFDWIHTNINGIRSCFEDNFKKYHIETHTDYYDNASDNITTQSQPTYVIDAYGFIFKKEVIPLKSNSVVTINQQSVINSIINNKYKNRIEYFKQIMSDITTPIICLCNYNINDAIELQKLFIQYYNRTNNLYLINISLDTSQQKKPNTEQIINKMPNLYNVNLNTMNINVWKYMIDLVLRHIKNKNT